MHTITQQQGKDAVIRSLEAKYLPDTPTETHPPYGGLPNAWLDRDITISEVRVALHELNTRSAAGADLLTNKMLRNLDDASIEALTDYFNECWHSGKLPREWKTARTILIPKPGNPLDIGNLRPISLTSCVGKVLEHVVANRLMCSPAKSELFVLTPLRPGRKRTPLRECDHIKIVTASGQRIPEVSKIRFLGLLLNKSGRNDETINKLTTKAMYAIRLIHRVSA
ncbi:uncharacterized protein [Dermacentor albipictus]|uniref:uncharacterized protein n=1 Tax=Dermacentor albipictus TaxID=60249 RepID=UPI0038FC6FBD